MKLAILLVALLGLVSAAAAMKTPADFSRSAQGAFEAAFGGARNLHEAVALAKNLAPQRKCVANDEQCAANCVKPAFEYMQNNPDCFNDTGDIFPEGDLATAAELEQLCTCGPKIIKGMRLLFSALDCIGQDDESIPFEPDQLADVMEVMFEFQCIKQGGTAGEFCALVVQEAEAAYSLNGTRDWDAATNETKCDYLTELGCCGASYIAVFEDPRFTEFMSAVNNGDGEGSAEMNATIQEIKEAYTACGYTPSPCLQPGEKDTYVKAVASINADFAVLANNETALDAFKVAFREDVAAALNLSPPQVEIISVASGSVKVQFQIRGKANKDKLDSALSSGIPLTNVKQQSGFSSAADLDSSSTTSETVEEQNDLSPAASAAVPSLAALLLLALFALLQ